MSGAAVTPPNWPSGPSCHGWLALDARGAWRLRGEKISHAGLLAFLDACGESVNFTQRTGIEGDNNDLFPPHVAEWAAANTDELSLVRLELEETPDAITA